MRSPGSRFCASVILALSLALVSAFAQTPAAYKHDLYRMELATGQLIRDTFLGTALGGASSLAPRRSDRSILIGVADFDHNGVGDTVHFNRSTGTLEVKFYGGAYRSTPLHSTFLVTPGAGWSPRALADYKGDGQTGVLFVNDWTHQADMYFYGGPEGTTLLDTQTISSPLPEGWRVVAAADVNRDGKPDLILENSLTRKVMVNYLSDGRVLSSAAFGGSGLKGWSAVGMRDVNQDGHLDLIYANDQTGQIMVSYYGGSRGLTFLKSAYLDSTPSPGWTTVVPSETQAAAVSSGGPGGLNSAAGAMTSMNSSSSGSILLYVGGGTSSGDVSAVKSLLNSLGLRYATVNSSQLDSMSVGQLLAHRLFVMPGGNAVSIGQYLSRTATNNVRTAISGGMHYLGLCAGGFFAGRSMYNRLQMTGVIYRFFSAYYHGIYKEAVNITLPGGAKYDMYWQDGPDLSGWGNVVAKFPDGTAAVTEGRYGSGWAILCAVHPEAPASWRYGMKFTTPLSVDLAYAGTLVKAALAGSSLPHY
ncbi:MAG: VCBS repeat-containing protein [Acidobacteria bacterium]|nr:VCBS repeat-containing protein [Acidobacteriota bacterium]